MRIGIDLDGVIADNTTEIVSRLAQLDIKAKPSQWASIRLEDEYPSLPEGWLQAQFSDPLLYANAIAYEASFYTVNKWFYAGNDIFIVTSRNEEMKDVTEDWLDDWGIPYNRLYMGANRLEKSKVLQELECYAMIEDDPHEADIIATNGIKSFLHAQPYNNKYICGKGVIRVSSLYNMHNVLMRYPGFRVGRI